MVTHTFGFMRIVGKCMFLFRFNRAIGVAVQPRYPLCVYPAFLLAGVMSVSFSFVF